MNDSGTVATTGGGIEHQFAAVWGEDGQMVAVGDDEPGSPETLACGINDAGVVIGLRVDPEADDDAYQPLSWQEVDGTWVPTTVGPPGADSIASGINDAGVIVGLKHTSGGAWWQPAGGVAIEGPASVASVEKVNNNNLAIGYAPHFAASLTWNLTTGEVHELPVPQGMPAVSTNVLDLNDAGTVVGVAGGRPAIWSPSGDGRVVGPDGFEGIAAAIDAEGTVLIVRDGGPLDGATYVLTTGNELRLLSRDVSLDDLNDHGVAVGTRPSPDPDGLVQVVRMRLSIGG